MGKVSEYYLQQQEQKFALDLSYAEWLRDNQSEPSEEELHEMEEDFYKSSAVKNRIVTHKSLNNKHYQPIHTTGA